MLYRRNRPDFAFYAKHMRGESVAAAPAAALWNVVSAIGGDNGYYFLDALWKLRGRLDQFAGGSGMTRVPEMLAMGINVAFGHDCVMDPWYSLGSADMLEVAQMGLHVAQMTSQSAMRECFAAVTSNPARILDLPHYGIAPGCAAHMVLLDARDPIEAIRLRASRLFVWRSGELLASSPKQEAQLHLPGRPHTTELRLTPSL